MMNGDELAARMRAEQGYLVHPFRGPMEIGEVFKSGGVTPDRLIVRTPLKVVAVATKEQLLSQRALAHKWGVHGVSLHTEGTHFYFVEAAD